MWGNFPLIIRCSWIPAVAALWFLCRLNIRIEIGADFKSRLSTQKFVRPQELVHYKIKKVVNLSRFATPISAVAIQKISTWSWLQSEQSFWGAEACTESRALSLDSHPCFSCNTWCAKLKTILDFWNPFGILNNSIHRFWSLVFTAAHSNEIAFWISFFLPYSPLTFEWKILMIKILGAISK